MEEENLMHNCDVVGTYYLQQLNKLKQQGVPMIGDVRGNCMNLSTLSCAIIDFKVRPHRGRSRLNAVFKIVYTWTIFAGKASDTYY